MKYLVRTLLSVLALQIANGTEVYAAPGYQALVSCNGVRPYSAQISLAPSAILPGIGQLYSGWGYEGGSSSPTGFALFSLTMALDPHYPRLAGICAAWTFALAPGMQDPYSANIVSDNCRYFIPFGEKVYINGGELNGTSGSSSLAECTFTIR